jgi:hypothetical protein
MELVVAIGVVLTGVAVFFVSLVPKKYERLYVYVVGSFTVVFGILAAVLQHQRTEQLNTMVERLGTPVDWSASEATVDIIAPHEKVAGAYSLVVKVIPADHEGLRGQKFALLKGHAFNEPSYLDEEDAKRLFWLLGREGAIDLRKEYESGIFTCIYAGSYNTATDLVEFKPDSQTYWPNPYPSLRDLEGKYVVIMLSAEDVSDPVFGFLKLKLSAPQGPQLLVFGVHAVRKGSGDEAVLIKEKVRYVGDLFPEGQFFKGLTTP